MADNAHKRTFDLVVDGVAYLVTAAPFSFNGGTRYYVSIDNGEDHVFAWDPEVSGLRIIDDESAIIPDTLEEAISQQLQSRM